MSAPMNGQGTIMRRKEVTRKDGLKVFLDGDIHLDEVRLNEPDRRKVILAVAIRRAQQIAMNYAERYAPDVKSDILLAVGMLGRKTPPYMELGRKFFK